jgi:hypothetical protein
VLGAPSTTRERKEIAANAIGQLLTTLLRNAPFHSRRGEITGTERSNARGSNSHTSRRTACNA